MKSSFTSDVETRLQTLEEILNESMKIEVQKSSGKWIIPFIVLIVVLVIVLGISYVLSDYLELVIE